MMPELYTGTSDRSESLEFNRSTGRDSADELCGRSSLLCASYMPFFRVVRANTSVSIDASGLSSRPQWSWQAVAKVVVRIELLQPGPKPPPGASDH